MKDKKPQQQPAPKRSNAAQQARTAANKAKAKAKAEAARKAAEQRRAIAAQQFITDEEAKNRHLAKLAVKQFNGPKPLPTVQQHVSERKMFKLELRAQVST